MFRTPGNLFKRQYVRLKGWLTLGSVGITPRLIVAFASVAALAAAANVIVENGVAVLDQQRNVELERSAHDSEAINTLRESVGRAQQIVTSAELAVAVGRFDRAVHEHAEADSRTSAARYGSARAALDRLFGQGRSSSQASNQPLPRLINTHKRSAEALLQSARVRHELLTQYSSVLSGMDTRARKSIDRAWKILGRVVAAQPLLDVRARLDDLRAAATTPGVFDAGDASTVSPLENAERAVAETLRDEKNMLRRSQGPEWYQGMSDDLALLVGARVALVHNEARRIAAGDSFARESRKLASLLPSSFIIESQPPKASHLVNAPVRKPVPFAKPNGSLVAWMSAAVLVVLSYICFVTIFSIVRPVRRMIAATNRLARGGNTRVVANGGIRELDALAVAFNSMAGQLAVARAATLDAHHRLEAKVEERTRQLQDLAERDPLTGVANRRQLFVALNESLERARVSRERVGVFFLDIDNFKTLNDSLGHSYGDRVLIAIARRLEEIARGRGFAARLGGDEFTIVHQGGDGAEDIVLFGAAIVRSFESPLQVDDREVIVSVSVGVSVFPDHEQDAEALLRAADAALFRAKALGRSQLAIFTPELLTTASAKFAIEQRLRRAIQNGEFELFYQPLVNLQTLDVELVEALIRWRTPDGSFRSPDEFLAVAEESGLIVEISDWVLRTAIQTAAQWHRGAWPGARVAINVSPRQFLDYRFVSKVEQLLEEFELPARCVELELTESVLQTGSHTIKTLDQLRSIGVAIALDDFGTGYSSLASLQQLPLTRVKLDRSLISGIEDSARTASIARATIALCRGLGLEVTAEGVERLEQFAMLLPHRAISLQGYLFSRPVPSGDLLLLLKRLPEKCQELLQLSQKLPAPVHAAQREKRRGSLALVVD
ncbi:MAG TPA: EAL domain-containing protein [Steroidobacteraceae bacterium]|jgi:diguanylate cyclase (GGDEF)-like protein|nr:EAL domain-containing protein [Steroidobacteraceae bacterium]